MREKATQKMTHEGAVEVSATTGEKKRISKRIRDADFVKTETPPQPEQAAQPLPGDVVSPSLTDTPSLPHAPGVEWEQDTAAARRVLERIDGARTRKVSKKAAKRAQAEAIAKKKSSRLQFTDKERATPELERYIRKSDEAADHLDAAKTAISKEKKLVRERVFDETTGKGKTRLHFEEQEKPIGKNKPHSNPLPRPVQEAGIFVHSKIHSVRKDDSGVEGAHKSEELAERGTRYGAWKVKEGYHSHRLKPCRAAAKAKKATFKANMDFQYHKALHDNPQIAGSPLSRFMQKQQIKRQYAKSTRKGGARIAQKAAKNAHKVARKTAEETEKAIAFVGRYPAGVCIAVAALLLFIMVSAGFSPCGPMLSGLTSGILGIPHTLEDSDFVATENNYAVKENGLQQQIDSIGSTHPGYDEHRYDLDSIGHSPYGLASYLTALLQTYTSQNARVELNRAFAMRYTLTLIEETEIRYRIEINTDPEIGKTTIEEVPHEYHIPNVKLTNEFTSEIAKGLPMSQQLKMYHTYLETSGNKPLIFGGGPPDMDASEDLSGIQLVNGTRPGNTAAVDLAKQQVGSVGERPPWSWHGFSSRVEWCACFVSWCYNQAGKSKPRFVGCQLQGVPWFQSRGQWGARGYENIAPGGAISFGWDGDGSADHVGLIIGTDGERVYTVKGNSGDAYKIKSYPVDYSCTEGHGLMDWSQHISEQRKEKFIDGHEQS